MEFQLEHEENLWKIIEESKNGSNKKNKLNLKIKEDKMKN